MARQAGTVIGEDGPDEWFEVSMREHELVRFAALVLAQAGEMTEQPGDGHSTARYGEASTGGDAARLDWLERQDLNDLVFGMVHDAPHDGEYVVNAGNGPRYGITLRAAIDAAMSDITKGRV